MTNRAGVEEWLTHDGLCALCDGPISVTVLYTVPGVKTVFLAQPACEHLKSWTIEARVTQEDGVG